MGDFTADDIERLRLSAIDVKPISIDWTASSLEEYSDAEGTGMSWSYWQSVKCDECGKLLVGSGYILCERSSDEEAFCRHCEEAVTEDGDGNWVHESDSSHERDGHVAEPDSDYRPGCGYETLTEGPMANAWYPVQINDPMGVLEAAEKLIDLPLCVVEVNDETGLALTGGGMDFSWEICEAFMLLGYLPPLHFTDLPSYGKGLDAKQQAIVTAAMRSAQVAQRQARYTIDRLAKRFDMTPPKED